MFTYTTGENLDSALGCAFIAQVYVFGLWEKRMNTVFY